MIALFSGAASTAVAQAEPPALELRAPRGREATGGEEYEIGPELSAWKSPGHQASEILEAVPEIQGSGHLGYQKEEVWLRIKLHNEDSPTSNSKWVLVIYPPLLNDVELFQYDADHYLIHTAEFHTDHRRNRNVQERRRASFPIVISPGQSTWLIFRIKSIHNLDFSVKVFPEEVASQNDLVEQMALGFYYGVFITIFLVNLFMGVATREKTYFYYIGFTSAVGMMVATLSGILDQYGNGVFPFSRYLCTMTATTVTLANLFTRDFLQTGIRLPRLDRIHRFLLVISIGIFCWSLTPLALEHSVEIGHAVDASVAILVLVILTSATVSFLRGFKPAFYFLISWTVLLTLVVIYFAAAYGVIPSSTFTRYAVHVGSALEMVFLSMALADRVAVLKKEKKQAERKSKDAERLRSLVHIICHDLKNPLTVIKTYSELHLKLGHEEWRPILKAAEQQRAILDYVSFKDALDSGKKKLDLKPVSILEMVENARFIFSEKIAAKGILLTCNLELGGAEAQVQDLQVMADPTLLSHTILNNLISNAIKFSSPGGRVRILVRKLPEGRVEVVVEDQGIGIPPGILANIFSMSAHTTRPGTLGEEGHGFGMPLVESVLKFFDGTIEIESHARQTTKDFAIEDVFSENQSVGTRPGTRVRITLLQAHSPEKR